jgi:hypothetical protein
LNNYYQSIHRLIFSKEVDAVPWWTASRNIILTTIATGLVLCVWTWTVQHSEHPLIAYQTQSHTSSSPPKRNQPDPSPNKPPARKESPQTPPSNDTHVTWGAVFLATLGATAAYFGASVLATAGVTAGTLATGTILVTAAPATAALAVGVVIFLAVNSIFGPP